MESTELITGKAGKIAGTLRVHASEPKRVVVLVHGILASRDAMFFPQLARSLPYSSYRFDLRGHGESDGALAYAGYDEDVEDIVAVVSSLRGRGYDVIGVIGHSRGGTSALRYAVLHGTNLLFCVNISGRFDMSRVIKKHTDAEREALERQGWFDWVYTSRGVRQSTRVTKDDFVKFASFDQSIVRRMSHAVSCVTIHGLCDAVVPTEDAASYANLIPNHTLVLLPDCDHFFKGKYDELCAAVLDTLSAEGRRAQFDRSLLSLPPQPRIVSVDGVLNFRDVGGYPTRDGRATRPRRVFRSAEMSELSPEGAAVLRSLNVRRVIDLRSDIERAVRPPPFDDDDYKGSVTCIPCAIFGEEDYSPAALEQRFALYASGIDGFVRAYTYMLEKGREGFARALGHVADALDADESVVFHCTGGKDRAGVLSMLLLGLLGVDHDIIVWDYELTERLVDRTPGMLTRLAGLDGTLGEESTRNLMSARAESMRRTIAALEQRWGGIERYARYAGVADDVIRRLRERLIVAPSVPSRL